LRHIANNPARRAKVQQKWTAVWLDEYVIRRNIAVKALIAVDDLQRIEKLG
jgi:hypothetical protein